MKKTLLTLTSVFLCAITFAQTVPQGINYQAVARDANGNQLTNQSLTVKLSIISDSLTGTVSWQETHPVTTNDYGLFTAIIGGGASTSVGSSTSFDVVDWGAASHYLQVEIDYGSGYVDMGTNQLLSVPYALHAGNPGPAIFRNDSNVTSNANGDYATDDFVFGSSTLDWNNNNDHAKRMFFDKSKGAFRVGGSNPAYAGMDWWDEDSLGTWSFASGYGTRATADKSTALGSRTNASGHSSTAMGSYTEASGGSSTAMGYDTEASGDKSTAMGRSTDATGDNSTAMGAYTQASGSNSTAMGAYTDATGNYSTAMGYQTEARAYQLVIGKMNVASGDLTNWVSTDAAFIIGNGVNSSSNSLRATKNGNLYITGTLSQSSDIRLKTNITPVGNVLSALEFITPITYEFKDTETHPAGLQIGFSAQEIQAQFPALVRENAKGDLTVSYGQMSAVLLQAIKEQQAIIESQKTEIADMRAEIDGRLKAIEETLNTTTLNK